MSKFTLYRADVDSPRLARVLGRVPGVAVGGEQASDRGAEDEPAGDAPVPEATAESDDEAGLHERIPVPDTDIVDEEKGSVVKTYGLLGLGVSMVMLGVATVGIWVYRRRKGDGDESETPPPAAAPTSPVATPADESVEVSETEFAEPRGRTEDRTDVEWTTRDTTPTGRAADKADEPVPEADKADEPVPAADEADVDEDQPRPGESVDAAPLLGAAFLAVSGAVVKWLQSGDEA